MEKRAKRGMGWKSFLFLFIVITVLVGIATPLIQRTQKAGNRTTALSGCKALAGGLVSFHFEYSHYPCNLTREALKKEGFKNIPTGNDANAYLAQLIATEFIDSETYFYCKAGKGYHKGDDEKDTPHNILAPGENSYAYVMAQNGESLLDTHSMTPIVIAPIISAGIIPKFDASLYADQYVYGAVDGSGKVGKIGPDGRALSPGREHLFQTGHDSLFGQQFPDVKLPTPRH